MRGYADDYSRSLRAGTAEYAGKFPASCLAKRLKVRVGAIKALLRPCEWHHTSARYNCTDYYDEAAALEILAELQAWRPAAFKQEVLENCTVEWLTWTGTRKRPLAEEHSANGCRVERVSRQFVRITTADGYTMHKKMDCTGLVVKSAEGKRYNP